MSCYKLPIEISKTIYAIGDVHGDRKGMNECLTWIQKQGSSGTIVFLGDIFDRGSDTKGCIKDIMDLKKERDINILRGNHEILAECSIIHRDQDESYCWVYNGGMSVLNQFEHIIDKKGYNAFYDSLKEYYSPFFNILQNNYKQDKLLFVHAGVSRNFETLDEALSLHWRHSLVNENIHWAWTREYIQFPIKEPFYNEWFLVHGHTPIQTTKTLPKNDIEHWHLNLDYGNFISPDGFVNCAKFEGNTVELMKELNI